jgi:hypothetical protein
MKGISRLPHICAFVGPTRLQSIPDCMHIFAPAVLGSVFRALQAGYKIVCLIDGYFGNTPSVWHKEILFALKTGVTVCGSSSMGALRAAELHPFGMIGFGHIYRAFRRGALQDDDEVCVLHAVQELNFAPLSEAMVNIRYTLRQLRRDGELSGDSAIRIASALKHLHFSRRTMAAVRSAFDQEFGRRSAEIFELYRRKKVDIKAADAELMFRSVMSLTPVAEAADWEFPATNHWLDQFLAQNADIPPLARWQPSSP